MCVHKHALRQVKVLKPVMCVHKHALRQVKVLKPVMCVHKHALRQVKVLKPVMCVHKHALRQVKVLKPVMCVHKHALRQVKVLKPVMCVHKHALRQVKVLKPVMCVDVIFITIGSLCLANQLLLFVDAMHTTIKFSVLMSLISYQFYDFSLISKPSLNCKTEGYISSSFLFCFVVDVNKLKLLQSGNVHFFLEKPIDAM